MTSFIPQGGNDSAFWQLVQAALTMQGFGSVPDFIENASQYWAEDENTWATLFPQKQFGNLERVFMQKKGTEYVPVIATYIADDAQAPLLPNEGASMVGGNIPRMAARYGFNAKAYDDSLRLMSIMGDAAGLQSAFNAFTIDNIKLLSSIYNQRTFTALQAESKGQYVTTAQNNAAGVKGVMVDFQVPATHKFKCGGVLSSNAQGTKYAWSSDSADPIGDLKDMYKFAWQNRVLPNMPERLVFRMSQTLYDVFKNQALVKKYIAISKIGNIDAANIPYVTITDADVQNYLSGIGLPKIEVVKTFSFTPYIDSTSMEIKKAARSAFDPNTVVLREAGAMGETQWYQVSNIFANATSPMYYANGGSIAIQQVSNASQRGMEFAAESLCVPVPYAANQLLYLDASTAAS